MIRSTTVLRRVAGAGLLCLALAACGGGDDDVTSESKVGAPVDPDASDPEICGARFIALLTDPAMVAAAAAGDTVPADLEDQLEDLEDECGDDFDAMTEAEFAEIAEKIDPAVLELVAGNATEEFQVTGDTIG